MEIVLLPKAKDDLNFWVRAGNKTILKKIGRMIEAITQNPYEGIGNPEPLKYELSGTWSRRINLEHRLIYEIVKDRLLIHSLKGHY
ncbi:MAG TPA: Txe/YoeB family addiction module toxin [Prolixibacteraceae bacterium]|nr:Txe/YoeB family addiction module toxin [Prolixibacteraceae bacterium]